MDSRPFWPFMTSGVFFTPSPFLSHFLPNRTPPLFFFPIKITQPLWWSTPFHPPNNRDLTDISTHYSFFVHRSTVVNLWPLYWIKIQCSTSINAYLPCLFFPTCVIYSYVMAFFHFSLCKIQTNFCVRTFNVS